MAPQEDSKKPKRCFVISPIGEAGSPERNRADKVFRHVIEPAAIDRGYEVKRADHDHRPGSITSQIVGHLIADDLVIADLTGHNANVFYELAIRHSVKKPVLQLVEIGQGIPFDVRHLRTIVIDHTDLDSAASCREQLMAQINAVENDPGLTESPITQAVQLRDLAQSPVPEDQRYAQILELLHSLGSQVNALASIRNASQQFEKNQRILNARIGWPSDQFSFNTFMPVAEEQLRRRLNIHSKLFIPEEVQNIYYALTEEIEKRLHDAARSGVPLSLDGVRRIVDTTVIDLIPMRSDSPSSEN